MILDDFFEPIDQKIVEFGDDQSPSYLGSVIKSYEKNQEFPDFSQAQIAIIGVKEDRRCFNNDGCGMAPDFVRKYLYRLFKGSYNPSIVDLGNIRRGNTVNDTYVAVSTVIAELLQQKILPIIIGGSQDLTYANYLAYENLGQIINLVSVDNTFDLGKTESNFNSRSFLSKIILHQPNFLFNYATIGYQTYFVDQEALDLMNNMYFDSYRLGNVRADMEEVEPIVRNADIMSFDISAIRHSDAPGNGNSSPNGFYGEEACQIVRYAGLSDKLSSIGFYEANPALDSHEQTCHLVSQMIWYFLEGFYNRKKDFPMKDKDDYIKYRVAIQHDQHELIFYKSKKSDRWWMEVPYQSAMSQYERHHLVPCSYNDYLSACREEMPDRWWQAYQKLT